MHRLHRYFAYDHLPAGPMRHMSMTFHDLATEVASSAFTTDEAERTVALRKLLEAKDAAVRSVIPLEQGVSGEGQGPA